MINVPGGVNEEAERMPEREPGPGGSSGGGGGDGVDEIKRKTAQKLNEVLDRDCQGSEALKEILKKMGQPGADPTGQSLAAQLMFLNRTRRNLQDLQLALADAKSFITDKCSDLARQQLVFELFEKILPFRQQFIEAADRLIRHLEEQHISYVVKESERVCRTLEAIGLRKQ